MKFKTLLPLLLMLLVMYANAYKQQSIDINVNGQSRNMICYTPSTMQDNMPLWIVTHGMNQNPEYQRDGDHLYELIDTAKFVVCYLRSDGSTWDTGGTKDQNFVLQTIDEMQKKFGINKNRVYWSGFSMGSMLIYHCMPAMLDKIAAFAPCSGIQFSESPWNSVKKPVNLIHCHGKNDSVFPLDQYDPRGYAAHFADVNKCTTYKKITNYQGWNGSGDKELWTDGTNGSELEIYMINYLDHTPDRVYAKEIWNFCKRFSLVEGPTVESVYPESGSFDMENEVNREFRVNLTKVPVLNNLKATLVKGTVSLKMNVATENDGKTLVLTLNESSKVASGDWTLTIANLESTDGGRSADYKAYYKYGVEEVGEEMKIDTLYNPIWDEMKEVVGEGIPKGWKCIMTDSNGKTVTKKYTDSIEAKASHLMYFTPEGEFTSAFLFFPYKNTKVELQGTESTSRAKLKATKVNIRFKTIYNNTKSRSNKVALNFSLVNSSDKSVSYEETGIVSKNYYRSTNDYVTGSIEHEFTETISKSGVYNVSFWVEHALVSTNYNDGIIMTAPLITTAPSAADVYKGGFLRAMSKAKALLEQQKDNEELAETLDALSLVVEQYEGYSSVQPSDYTAATNALEEAMKPILAVGIQPIQVTDPSANVYYDLSGRRVEANKPGIYVRNGKVVVK